MSPATTGYANINGGKLYYEIGGEGHPLVLVHAGPTDSRIWDDQWDEFTRHYRVIRFDMRPTPPPAPSRAATISTSF